MNLLFRWLAGCTWSVLLVLSVALEPCALILSSLFLWWALGIVGRQPIEARVGFVINSYIGLFPVVFFESLYGAPLPGLVCLSTLLGPVRACLCFMCFLFGNVVGLRFYVEWMVLRV